MGCSDCGRWCSTSGSPICGICRVSRAISSLSGDPRLTYSNYGLIHSILERSFGEVNGWLSVVLEAPPKTVEERPVAGEAESSSPSERSSSNSREKRRRSSRDPERREERRLPPTPPKARRERKTRPGHWDHPAGEEPEDWTVGRKPKNKGRNYRERGMAYREKRWAYKHIASGELDAWRPAAVFPGLRLRNAGAPKAKAAKAKSKRKAKPRVGRQGHGLQLRRHWYGSRFRSGIP